MDTFLLRCLACLFCAAALPALAHEWDVRWTGDTHPAAVVEPLRYVSTGGGSDSTGWVSDSLGGLTRFAASGAILARVRDAGASRVLRNLPDGGALVIGDVSVSRIDAHGNALWQYPVDDVDTATLAGEDSGATWWIGDVDRRLYKHGPDGQRLFSRRPIDLDMARIEAVAVSPDGRLALAVGATLDQRITSVRLSRKGNVLSGWTGPIAAPQGEMYWGAVVIDADHALTVGINADYRLVLAHHDALGATILRSQDFHFYFGYVFDNYDGLATAFATRNGLVLIIDNISKISSSQTAWFLSATGELLHANGAEDWFGNLGPDPRILENPQGVFWMITRGYDPVAGRTRPSLHRIDATSQRSVYLRDEADDLVPRLAVPPDASGALVVGTGAYRTDLDGGVVALPPVPDLVPMSRVYATTDELGDSYVVQRVDPHSASPVGATLTRIGRDGVVRWSVPVAADMRFPTDAPAFRRNMMSASSNDHVCFVVETSNRLYCHAAVDGAPQGSVQLPGPAYDSLTTKLGDQHLRRRFSGALPAVVLDGKLGYVPPSAYYSPDFMARRLHSASGHQIHFDGASATSINRIRRETRLGPVTQPPLTWTLGSERVPAMLPDGEPAVMVLEDGAALLLSRGIAPGSPLELQHLNADGSLGYRTPIAAVWSQANFELVDGRVLISTYHSPPGGPGESRLFGVGLADGRIAWQHQVVAAADGNASSEITVAPDRLHAIWWTSDLLDVNARRIRLSDGVQVERVDLPCTSPCLIDRVMTDAHGSTVLPQMYRRERPLFESNIRADQETIEGAWYQPNTSGQGIVFDYLDGPRTWFGTWHTADLSGVTSSAALRWLVLQGEVAVNGTQVPLGIYLASGGRFDQAPPVASQRIGEASLSFDTCGTANLEYRFTVGEWAGVSGAIPLRALTPYSEVCAATGAPPFILPSQVRNGIDTRFSGSWYEPATSGQGLELVVRRDLGNGAVFAGWFSFDPDQAADDEDAQHWFTLQGDLDAAVNGEITLPILRTLAGKFDEAGSRNTSRVGEVHWRFIDCSHSVLSYRFDDSDVAGAYAGRQGTMELQRLGNCPSP